MTELNGLTSDDFITVYDPPPGVITDQLREIATRRLAMITTTLALAPDEFERAHQAMLSALDGGHDRILSEQRQQIVGALPDIIDPLTRARAVELFNKLASGGSD